MNKGITKDAVAKLLGCTDRQIQRYTKQGRLTVEYFQEGRTKKAYYNEQEVRALKEQLAQPELRAIPVREISAGNTQQQANQQLATTRAPALNQPPQALQNLIAQLGGGAAPGGDGCGVSFEEFRAEKVVVQSDGSTKLSGVSVTRYAARA